MNTIQSLTENGIQHYTAEKMIESYKEKIGTMNGIYEIVDIEYDFDIRGKIVTLKCSECGKVIHRTMVQGKNKWSELIKTCECQKEKKRLLDFEKSEKIKKEKKEVREKERIIKISEMKNKPHRRVFNKSYIGNRYNFLTVIDVIQEQGKPTAFICQCEACGRIKRYSNPTNVVNLSVKSCGCMHDKLLSTHGLSGTRLYSILNGMKQRCYNKKCENYYNYGGRGIKICDEWLNKENGNYEPSNCRWADWFTQANNRRPMKEWKERRKRFEINKEKYTMGELCRIHNITEPAIRYRMKTHGMTLEQALKTPKNTNGRHRKAVNE